MSLIEIMIALAIAASVMGMGTSMLSTSVNSQMRRESSRLITLTKYLYNEATLRNQYIRLVFDLDEQKYFAEVSDKPFYIARADDEAELIRKKNEEEASGDDDSEGEAAPAPVGAFAEADNDNLEVYEVSKDLRIADVFVFHGTEKVTEGKEYLYFFPRGLTEFAVIHLGDEEGEKFMTLIVNPLTGSVEVRPEYVEHSDLMDELMPASE